MTVYSNYPRPAKATRVLVVDDDAQSCRLLSMLLERLGYDTRFAKDGESALVAASVWRPDIVILDITMPWMDGLETCRLLRDTPNGPRVIALTGHADDAWRQKTRDAGFDAHIVKGSPLPELLAALEPMPTPAA